MTVSQVKVDKNIIVSYDANSLTPPTFLLLYLMKFILIVPPDDLFITVITENQDWRWTFTNFTANVLYGHFHSL